MPEHGASHERLIGGLALIPSDRVVHRAALAAFAAGACDRRCAIRRRHRPPARVADDDAGVRISRIAEPACASRAASPRCRLRRLCPVAPALPGEPARTRRSCRRARAGAAAARPRSASPAASCARGRRVHRCRRSRPGPQRRRKAPKIEVKFSYRIPQHARKTLFTALLSELESWTLCAAEARLIEGPDAHREQGSDAIFGRRGVHGRRDRSRGSLRKRPSGPW